jgi:hypothetical protein
MLKINVLPGTPDDSFYSWADSLAASALYAVGSYFLRPLFFLYPSGDHSLDPSRLAEDGLGDNNLMADSPDDFGAYYILC